MKANGTRLPNRMQNWLDQNARQRNNIRTLKLLTALFVVMPTHYLEMEICDTIQMYLRSVPKGWQPLKKSTVHLFALCLLFKVYVLSTHLLNKTTFSLQMFAKTPSLQI